ncbi:uncharacterized protein JN550_009788 [Neoarthrinium moseri]|uniref:uncharacterized protein n=1 Tax=Neoarthrinium moseri TaxID=1658444 RepID=UPI001FDADC86|nr:uncharacterized protein JN550_009788 [Neoarthrinium moseri]KAI1863262.1 hypothetical protein JN550_009788 [Neoarthrinium moseri]
MASFSNIVEIERDGELLLHVGAETSETAVTYRVCPRALARAAKFFQTLLYGPWAEGKRPDGDWVVELPEDKPSVVVQILLVVHSQFDKAFADGSGVKHGGLAALYDVAVLSDKYDLVHLLRPWLPRLKGESRPNPGPDIYSMEGNVFKLERMYRVSIEKDLFVAWEIGGSARVRQCITDIALRSRWMKGKLVHASRSSLCDLFLHVMEPTGVRDIIAKTRRAIVSSILKHLEKAISNLADSNGKFASDSYLCCKLYNSANSDWRKCHATVLGSLIQGLAKLLIRELNEIKVLRHTSHTRCKQEGVWLDPQREPKLFDFEPKVEFHDAQTQHLKTQARKSGINDL